MNRYLYNSEGVLDRIVTPCDIDVADYDVNNEMLLQRQTVKALWDIGATVTVLSEEIVNRMGLIPSDVSRVSGWDGKPIMTNIYNVDIVLDGLRIEFVNAVRGPLKNIDMILGMDVICQGDLHITHPNYSTLLEFSIN